MPTTEMEKQQFTIKVTYFKTNGKYYTEATVERNFRATETGCFMADVVAWIRGNAASGGPGAMPGLSDRSEGWDGHILVECDKGYPCLIPNLKRK